MMINLNVILFVAIVSCIFFCCLGEQCQTLEGSWFNHLGSMMTLSHSEDSRLTGKYLTAVERKPGSAGTGHSGIIGVASWPFDKESLFGFAVTFRNGASTVAWTGQCLVCNGTEMLLTSWLLRSRVDACIDRWRSTMIGQDVFTRTEQVAPSPSRKKRDVFAIIEEENKDHHHLRRKYGRDVVQPCSLSGLWFTKSGGRLEITHHNDGTVLGNYQTSAERRNCKGFTEHSSVVGVRDITAVNNTMAIFVLWNHGRAVTGWVGQCQVCSQSMKENLETTWLQRHTVNSCHLNWKSTFYGETRLLRDDTLDSHSDRLGSYSPEEEGEEQDTFVSCYTSKASLRQVTHSVIVSTCFNIMFSMLLLTI